MPSPSSPRRPLTLPAHRPLALLFLLSILPVLLIVGALNYRYTRATLEQQAQINLTADTNDLQLAFAQVILRELERLTTIA
ncbi:MAG TPA: hypothetical protein VKY74_17040, partial [Chloroflexia bacterium]|nr:hypothetical protein [Chloroflexia bacterium]